MSKSDTAANYASGVAAYYLMVYGLLFYPVIVMIQQFGNSEDNLTGGFLAGGITTFVIWLLFTIYINTKNIIPLLLLISVEELILSMVFL